MPVKIKRRWLEIDTERRVAVHAPNLCAASAFVKGLPLGGVVLVTCLDALGEVRLAAHREACHVPGDALPGGNWNTFARLFDELGPFAADDGLVMLALARDRVAVVERCLISVVAVLAAAHVLGRREARPAGSVAHLSFGANVERVLADATLARANRARIVCAVGVHLAFLHEAFAVLACPRLAVERLDQDPFAAKTDQFGTRRVVLRRWTGAARTHVETLLALGLARVAYLIRRACRSGVVAVPERVHASTDALVGGADVAVVAIRLVVVTSSQAPTRFGTVLALTATRKELALAGRGAEHLDGARVVVPAVGDVHALLSLRSGCVAKVFGDVVAVVARLLRVHDRTGRGVARVDGAGVVVVERTAVLLLDDALPHLIALEPVRADHVRPAALAVDTGVCRAWITVFTLRVEHADERRRAGVRPRAGVRVDPRVGPRARRVECRTGQPRIADVAARGGGHEHHRGDKDKEKLLHGVLPGFAEA